MGYKTYKIPKNNGGFRLIEAPDKKTKDIQNEILKRLYKEVKISPFCHGGTPFRSIATNARAHINKRMVATIDIENFFNSITKEKFDKKVIYIKQDLKNVILENCFYKDHLPQGAPTSPYLANVYLYKFDWQCAWFCSSYGIEYSRYFDDITISTNNPGIKSKQLYTYLIKVINNNFLSNYQLAINTKKTRLITKKSNQNVCGVTVNEKLNVNRKYRNNLRSSIYHEMKENGKLSEATLGKISFVNSIREAKIPEKYSSNIRYLIEYLDNRIVLAQLNPNVDNLQINTLQNKRENLIKFANGVYE